MPRFKRRRAKNARAGCLLCHPHKANGAPTDSLFRASELRRLGGRQHRLGRRDVDWALDEE